MDLLFSGLIEWTKPVFGWITYLVCTRTCYYYQLPTELIHDETWNDHACLASIFKTAIFENLVSESLYSTSKVLLRPHALTWDSHPIPSH